MTAFSASTGRRKKTLWILAAVAALLLSSALAAEKPDDDFDEDYYEDYYEEDTTLGALDALPTASTSIDAEVAVAEAVEGAVEEIASGIFRNLGEGLLESDSTSSSWS